MQSSCFKWFVQMVRSVFQQRQSTIFVYSLLITSIDNTCGLSISLFESDLGEIIRVSCSSLSPSKRSRIAPKIRPNKPPKIHPNLIHLLIFNPLDVLPHRNRVWNRISDGEKDVPCLKWANLQNELIFQHVDIFLWQIKATFEPQHWQIHRLQVFHEGDILNWRNVDIDLEPGVHFDRCARQLKWILFFIENSNHMRLCVVQNLIEIYRKFVLFLLWTQPSHLFQHRCIN